MDFDAFDAFETAPAPAPAPAALRAASPAVAGEKPPPPAAIANASTAFGHLGHECVASITYHGMDDDSRARLEEVLRECVVGAGTAPPPAPSSLPAACGAVHYFQAFAADYAGASSSAVAATAARPQYERLIQEPLPSRRLAGGGRGDGAGGGRGRGGGRGGGGLMSFAGRYYDEETVARPGQLSPELRALLGMRDGDPPPYLSRMQQLGYPPGYLGDPDAADVADRPLTLWSGGDEGESAAAEPSSAPRPPRHPVQVPLVAFPGLNVPPPAGSDARWPWRGAITH